jgi:hypothetical protein
MTGVPEPVRNVALQAVVGEVEMHVAEAGWDQPPQLFALVETDELLRAEPQLAQTMGIVGGNPGALTPIAQEPLGDGPLDEALARIEFTEAVLGVVLAHEVVVLPPSAEAALEEQDGLEDAHAHPDAREVRMVVGVLRGGGQAAVLRLRGLGEAEDDRVTGPDLAPALAAALTATLEPGGRAL